MHSPTHITVDFETRSEVDLKKSGAWRYAEDPTTEILCLAYKIDDDSPQLWAPHMDFPQVLIDHANNGSDTIFEAHNVQFERAVWKRKLPDIPLPRYWEDTLAACAYRALPLALDKAGEALDLDIQKDPYGKRLINMLCKPRRPTKNDKRKWREELGLLEDLYEYCKQDTDAEHALRYALGHLTPDEQRTWVLDQTINERGVYFDSDAIYAGLEIIGFVTERLTKELQKITEDKNGVPAVENHDKLSAMKKWLRENDVDMPDMTADTVSTKIEALDKGSGTRRVLEIRKTLGKASIKKLDAMLNVICKSGRAYGMLQYHGASTGRWAGRLIQPHNMPRGDTEILAVSGMDGLVDLIKKRDPELIGMIHGYERIPDAISTSLRGMIIATPGNELYVGDFATIEARQTMWVCNQMDAVQTFADYDKGIGADIYCTMASAIMGYPVNKKDHPHERQLGKITVLGCGYQMGGKRLQTQAYEQFGVDLTLTQAESMVNSYRNKYQKVRNTWYGLQEGVGKTILDPGLIGSLNGKIYYGTMEDEAGNWLVFRLPNKRKLWFYKPECEVENWIDQYGRNRLRYNVSYMARSSKHQGRWMRVRSYGGMMLENIVQALARDTMVESMFAVEEANYPIVLTIHDEVISDVPKGYGSIEEFTNLMARSPAWAADCPITVEAWKGERYRK